MAQAQENINLKDIVDITEDTFRYRIHMREGWQYHPVKGYDADFIDNIDKHCAYVLKYFKKSEKELDFSLESLKLLDSLIFNITWKYEAVPTKTGYDSYKILLPKELYDGLVAYCGEVVRRKIDGKWLLKKYREVFTFFKDVELPNNPEYTPILVDKEGNEKVGICGIIAKKIDGDSDWQDTFLYSEINAFINSFKHPVILRNPSPKELENKDDLPF